MITTILIFFFVLSVLVLVHEWGHYFTAKRAGVKVEEFGLGFPPRAFVWKGKDGMKWSLNWIPLGGFVKIKGETGQDRGDKDSFASKSIATRILILAAGVIMNFVLAAGLFTLGFAIGIPAIIEGDVDGSVRIAERNVTVTEIVAGSPVDEVGVKPGDVVVSINGEEYASGADARAALEVHDDSQRFTVTFSRDGELMNYVFTPAYFEEYDRSLLGMAIYETGTVRYSLYLAPLKGIETTYVYTREILFAFGGLIAGLFTGDSAGAEVAGPIGIAKVTGEVAQLGIIYLIQFAAILSINLAIINILPIPALDGGRILFVLIEAIRRKPNSQRIEGMIHNTGFILLMLLVVVVTYKDIVNLVRG